MGVKFSKLERSASGPGSLPTAAAEPVSVGSPIGRRRLLERFTFALPLLVLLLVGVQLTIAALLHPEPYSDPDIRNSIAATLFVNVVAALIFREFRRTPGTRRFSYIIPSFVVPILKPRRPTRPGVLLRAFLQHHRSECRHDCRG